MRTGKVLVAFYSCTGRTADVADVISKTLACDIEALVDITTRTGLLGYLSNVFDATFGRFTILNPTKYDPSAYDLVIVGTPIWNASPSAAIRTYLTASHGRLKNVAFFCTYGGRGSRRAFRQMRDACARRPVSGQRGLALRRPDSSTSALPVSGCQRPHRVVGNIPDTVNRSGHLLRRQLRVVCCATSELRYTLEDN